MASMSLKDFNTDIETIKNSFNKLITNQNSDIYKIFSVAIQDFDNFPNKTGLDSNSNYIDYLKVWIKSYNDAMNNLPSTRIANPKGSCDDPSIKQLVKTVKNLTDDEADDASKNHNLFMSAENIQGALLEEFISSEIKPYGWLWCNGSIIHAVDFCTSDGSCLLQVKNKNNTENSSSSAIRNGTSIQKWYRLGTKKINGLTTPDFKWDNLNSIINAHNITNYGQKCNITEDKYQQFLSKISVNNPNIITDK